MRIVLLGPANVIHTRRWFYALCALGHDVALISQHRHDGLQPPPTGRIHYLPYSGTKGYFLNAVCLRRLLKSIRPDVVNVHYASGYGTLSSIIKCRPRVVSVWGSDVYDFPYEMPPLKMSLIRWVLRRSDRVTSTSKMMAAHVRKLAPGVTQVDEIPFGVETDVFRPLADINGGGAITIGTVKTLEQKYGIDTTIRAFARVYHDEDIRAAGLRSKLKLVLVGGGSQGRALRALAHELGVGDCTTFVGAVEHSEVPRWLNQFDVYVAMSRRDSESFGVAVVEASSCALPVIVSDKGGLPEVVEANATGFVVAAEDYAMVARFMKVLVLDEQLRQTMGAAGRQRVIANYEWRSCVEMMIACYRNAIRLSAEDQS